ncbi:MAG: type II 3-dehydroquinate dehydratase [Thermoleophilia bacterium]
MAGAALKTLWLIHGVNLDMLGRRDPRHYGDLTLASLEEQVTTYAFGRGFTVQSFHTNHEGVLVEHLHLLSRGGIDALIINPGAWTHYSYAMHDALELIVAPVAEVHLSAIENREQWRRHSVIADLAVVRVSGQGVQGYFAAVDALAALLGGAAPTGLASRGDAPTDDDTLLAGDAS